MAVDEGCGGTDVVRAKMIEHSPATRRDQERQNQEKHVVVQCNYVSQTGRAGDQLTRAPQTEESRAAWVIATAATCDEEKRARARMTMTPKITRVRTGIILAILNVREFKQTLAATARRLAVV